MIRMRPILLAPDQDASFQFDGPAPSPVYAAICTTCSQRGCPQKLGTSRFTCVSFRPRVTRHDAQGMQLLVVAGPAYRPVLGRLSPSGGEVPLHCRFGPRGPKRMIPHFGPRCLLAPDQAAPFEPTYPHAGSALCCPTVSLGQFRRSLLLPDRAAPGFLRLGQQKKGPALRRDRSFSSDELPEHALLSLIYKGRLKRALTPLRTKSADHSPAPLARSPIRLGHGNELSGYRLSCCASRDPIGHAQSPHGPGSPPEPGPFVC
jgi:hypothetical protein